MKASDIPDEIIYDLVAKAKWTGTMRPSPLMTWDTFRALPQFPEKIVLAKLRQMIAKGRLEGCACGCRGDLMFPWEQFGGPYSGRERWRERLAEWKQDQARARQRD